MTIVIITNKPREDWDGKNVKRFVYGKDFTFFEVKPTYVLMNNMGIATSDSFFQRTYIKEDITSITITY